MLIGLYIIGLCVAVPVIAGIVAHLLDPQETPEQPTDTYIPVLMDLGSTESERAEYRAMASRNRETFWCTPGTRRSATCPYVAYDARNDYKCGWCCVPARSRKGLPTK